jgi:hypothetical protein
MDIYLEVLKFSNLEQNTIQFMKEDLILLEELNVTYGLLHSILHIDIGEILLFLFSLLIECIIISLLKIGMVEEVNTDSQSEQS